MKNLITFFLILSLFPFTALNSANIVQQQDATYVLRGRVLGGDTNQPLVNASVSVQSVNVSTVTNQDGYFSIRVPAESRNSTLIIRHLGYSNMEIPVVTLIDSPNNHITLVPSPIQLIIAGYFRRRYSSSTGCIRRIPETMQPTQYDGCILPRIGKAPAHFTCWSCSGCL